MMATKIPPAKPEVLSLFRAELIKQGIKYETADSLRLSFGISRDEARAVYRELAAEHHPKVPKKPAVKKLSPTWEGRSRAAEARAYAAQHDVTGYRLRQMFGITPETARRIAKEFNDGSPTRLEASRKNQELARTHCYAISGKVSSRELSRTFGIGENRARDIVAEVRADLKQREAAAKIDTRPRRKVRVFCEISHSDMTDDRRRYPSGIGFAVLEVVR